jgi:alkaline phosphatase
MRLAKRHFPTMRSLLFFLAPLLVCTALTAASPQPGSVIFIHPDGTSLNTWNAARIHLAGPDAMLEWDHLPQVGLYRSHYKDSLHPTSHGGGTVHAWGVKVVRDSYGMDGQSPVRARSGADKSVMQEAQAAGLAVGIINTGHLAEPGSGVFLASSAKRADYTGIARTILESGAEVILAGGEIYLLPAGVVGRHGQPGLRTDGLDLIAAARAAGYTVVYDRAELLAAAADPATVKLLGIFAAVDTYNYDPEEALAAAGLPLYNAGTPDVADMTRAALQVFERLGRRFILAVEEEGTDNFANRYNAAGTFEALRRADAAIGVAREFLARHPDTLILTAADSDAGAMQIVDFGMQGAPDEAAPVLPPVTKIGTPLDGVAGTGTAAFLSAPDARGHRFWFGVSWGAPDDVIGAVVARAAGLNAERLRVNLDNTQLYDLMWETLFGRELPAE